MVQHLLLVLVAAPLLVLGAPHRALAWSLPLEWRRPAGRWWMRSATVRMLRRTLGNAAVATVLHAVAMWAWHAPVLYEAALWHEGWHALEHASIGAALTMLWRWLEAAQPSPAIARARASTLPAPASDARPAAASRGR